MRSMRRLGQAHAWSALTMLTCSTIVLASTACTTMVQSMGIALLYRNADHPAEYTRLDVPYVAEGELRDIDKQSLDLY